jgi:hypothetical protein
MKNITTTTSAPALAAFLATASAAAMLFAVVPAWAQTMGLDAADPALRVRAALAACIAHQADPAAPAAAARAAGWQVEVAEGSGAGLAVFRQDTLVLSLGEDGRSCSVHATDRPMAAMDADLREALAAAGLSAQPSTDPWNDCAVLDIGGGRRAVVTANTTDFTCGGGDQSAVFIYTR